MADSAVQGSGLSEAGGTAHDDPLDRAVWRLRSRACWEDAAALLDPLAGEDPAAALKRAALLVERAMFTGDGWTEAEDALRTAEAVADTDDERGAAACERGQLAYAATVLGIRDRTDEARAALGRSAALLPPSSPGRPLLDYRRGLLAERFGDAPQAARAAYRRAHAGATAQGDELLCSFTWRHLAGLAAREGELAEARQGFTESLRIREKLGYLVGMAPALVSLADVRPEPEAERLREEAGRLFRLLGRVPTWLAPHLDVPPHPAADAAVPGGAGIGGRREPSGIEPVEG